MSIISAAFKVHSVIQILIPAPYHFDTKHFCLIISPLYSKLPYKTCRILQLAILIWYLPFVFVRVGWLFYHFKTYAVHEIEQVVFYSIALCMIIDCIAAVDIQQNYFRSVIHLFNQTFGIVQTDKSSVRTKINSQIPYFRSPSFSQLYIYGFSSCFFAIVIACFAAPLAVSYLPLQLLCKGVETNIVIKLCDSFLFGLAVAYGAFSILSVNLIAIVFLHNINFHIKGLTSDDKSNFWFSKKLKHYKRCQLVVNLASGIYSRFLTVLIFIGTMLASSCASVTIRMYGKIDILTYLLFPSITIICVVNAIILSYMGNIPYQQFLRFKLWCSSMKLGKEDKRRLKACKSAGFSLGPYGICTAALGLRICNDYINNTVTILLLGFL